MKNIIIYVLLLFTAQSFSQTKFLSWNLENFGKSKTQSSLNFIASTVQDYDIITIQEIVTGYNGTQTVAKLSQLLNEKGSK